jgi:hypothetical protein
MGHSRSEPVGLAGTLEGQVMGTQILEGTLSEIQRQISKLPYGPDTRLRVIIEEKDTEASETAGAVVEPFHPMEFRNGIPLLPRRKIAEPITTDFVKRLLDEEDEEILRAYRTPGR